MMVMSEDTNFLATSANLALEAGLLVWPTQLLAITRRPLSKLDSLRTAFSQTNAVILSCPSPVRCGVWSYLPYSPLQAQLVQVAKWSPSSGLTLRFHPMLYPDKFHQFSQRPMLVVAAEEFPPHVLVKKVPSEAGWESNRVPNEAGGTNFTMNGPMDTLLQTLAHSLNFS
ncbi:hypothetical protein Pmani_015545 [Petrolisthes manimaculis]|nr:hypothetical protein Pmani_015545 [Petrolisthes manimaculis]